MKRGIVNASYLAIGNIITELIQFTTFVYVARLLGVEDYGVYVTVGAYVGIFGVITFGGLDKVLIREGSKDIAQMKNVLESTIGIKILCIILAMGVCVSSVFATPYAMETKMLVVLFSVTLAIGSFRSVIITIFQATEHFKQISMFNILTKVLVIGSSILVLHFGYGLWGLFTALILVNLIILLMIYRISKKYLDYSFTTKIRIEKDLLRSGFVFSLLAFLRMFEGKIDLLMVSFLGTSEQVGIYAVSYKMAAAGMLLRGTLGTSFFPIFVKRFHQGAIRTLFIMKYSMLLLVAFLSLSIIASFFTTDFIVTVFGSEYRESGEILTVLIFYLCASYSSLPFGLALQATHNEKLGLYIMPVTAGTNIVLNYLFFFEFGLIGIAYATLCVAVVGNGLLGIMTYKTLKKQGHLT